MVLTIDLLKRFGGATADITKARKGKPDVPGRTVAAWNAANPAHPKDSRGRWSTTGAMVSELMDVLRRHHGEGPNPVVAKLTEHIERTAHEAGLRTATRRGDLVRFDPAVHQISGRKPKPGTMVEVEAPGWDVAEWRIEGLPEAAEGKLRMVNLVPARVRRSESAAEHDFDAKPKRATARLTAKPELDYGHMVQSMRELPATSNSQDAVRRVLEPLTIPQLKELARTADVPVSSKMRKNELRDAIAGLVGVPDRTVPKASPKPTTERIRDAYTKLRREPIAWVDLADIRDELGDVDRAEQDRSLMELLDAKQIRLIPEENQKTIDARRRASALRLSGEDKHLLGFQDVIEGGAPAAKVTPKPADGLEGDTAGPAPSRADEINRLTAQISRTTDKGELAKLKERRAKLTKEVIHGTETPAPKPRARRSSEGNDLTAMRGVLERMRHDELKQEIMALEGKGTEGIAEAEARLSGMTVAQLKAFAATLGPTVKVSSKASKAEAIRQIVEGTIGFRQRSRAIGGWRHDEPSTPAGAGDSDAVVDRLRSLTSVAEGKALIGGKSKAELLAIAEKAGISRPSGKTKSELIDSITYMTIQAPGAFRRALGEYDGPKA